MNVIKISLVGLMLLIAGCNNSSSRVAILDLNVISTGTGQTEIINKEMEKVNASLSQQLQEITLNLNKQLAVHKTNFGQSMTPEQQQQLQELLIKANQQLQQKQNEAKTKSAQHKESVILAWRKAIQPVLKKIAKTKGLDVVLVQSPIVMWFDSSVDITDEVLAELRANPLSVEVNEGQKTIVLDASGNVI